MFKTSKTNNNNNNNHLNTIHNGSMINLKNESSSSISVNLSNNN